MSGAEQSYTFDDFDEPEEPPYFVIDSEGNIEKGPINNKNEAIDWRVLVEEMSNKKFKGDFPIVVGQGAVDKILEDKNG